MPKRAGSHHGDLKAALVESALALIAERGVAALSVDEVARRTEVSGGAPYRHFPNRQALLIAVSDLAGAAAVYALFTAEHGIGFDLMPPNCRGVATRI